MAETIKSIVNLDALGYDIETLKELDEDDRNKEIHDTVKDELTDQLQSEIDYFIDFDADNARGDFIFGFEKPEELKKEANEWNRELTLMAQDAFKKLTAFALEHAETADLAKAIPVLEEKFSSSEAMISKAGMDYEMCLYRLRHAIGMLDGRFIYGDMHLSIMTAEYSVSFNTKLHEEHLRDINEHPENYALIYTIYK